MIDIEVYIMDEKWRIRSARLKKAFGDCNWDKREIRIARDARGLALLDTIAHECLHAADWHLSDDFVEQYSTDFARIAFREELSSLIWTP